MSRSVVVFAALALAACQQEKLRAALPPDVRIDTYSQQAASKIDVLWVIDDSGSMAPRQENLARNFQVFIDTFAQSSIDYRIAVTTTDIFKERGHFVGNPAIITPQTPGVLAAFQANVRVGTAGSPYEVGMDAARMALEAQGTENQGLIDACQGRCPANKPACLTDCETSTALPFLRQDAYLYIAFLSDEDDKSAQDVRYFYRLFETAKGIGNDGMVSTAAIMGDTPSNTCGATPGVRYKALSDLTGGEVGSICDASFATALKKLANNAVGLKRKFALQSKPNVKTLEVRLKYPCHVPAEVQRPCAKVDASACAGMPGRLAQPHLHPGAGRHRRLELRGRRQRRLLRRRVGARALGADRAAVLRGGEGPVMHRSLATAALLALAALGCGNQGIRGVRPQAVAPPPSVDLGTVPVLLDASADIPLANVGRATLKVTNVTLADTAGVFELKTSMDEVPTGDTRAFTVVFTPLAEQAYAATLSFDTDDADNPHFDVALTGTGSTHAVMALEPANLDFGRVPECGAAVQQFTILSKGTADLQVQEIAFTDGTNPGFSFVGSTRTPATVKPVGANGLPGQIQLTVKLALPQGSSGPITGGIRIRGTDPQAREVIIPLSATVNRAPVPSIAPLGNGAPGLAVPLDGSASLDPDGDTPLTYKWTLRQKPLSSTTTIAAPDQATTSLRLDPALPGSYEVQLDVADAQGVKSCAPARATIVATPAEKLLVELFWDNAGTDLDLHVFRDAAHASLGTPPGDCFYQNPTPDWGQPGPSDDPRLMRDALTGYGPEVFGYVNPIDTTYRVAVFFNNDLLSTTPASKATVRVYEYGVLKSETSRTLMRQGRPLGGGRHHLALRRHPGAAMTRTLPLLPRLRSGRTEESDRTERSRSEPPVLRLLLCFLPLLAACPATQNVSPDSGRAPECQTRADCAAGHICTAQNYCDTCDSSGQCSLKEECVAATHLCALRDGWGTACVQNEDCQAGSWCHQGLCLDRAQVSLCPGGTTAECPRGDRCNKLTTVCEEDLGCTLNDDCSAGEVCNTGSRACVQRCTVDTQSTICAAGERCVGEKCVQCADASECGVGLVCDAAGRCVAGQRCYADRDCKVPLACFIQTGACLPKQPPCVSNDNCGADQRCEVTSGKCVPRVRPRRS